MLKCGTFSLYFSYFKMFTSCLVSLNDNKNVSLRPLKCKKNIVSISIVKLNVYNFCIKVKNSCALIIFTLHLTQLQLSLAPYPQLRARFTGVNASQYSDYKFCISNTVYVKHVPFGQTEKLYPQWNILTDAFLI